MTISSTSRQAGPFTGNGVTVDFPFTFKVFAASDLQVTKTSTAGVETVLTLTTDYTVALNADQNANPGGTITYNTLANDEKLTAVGNIPQTQPTAITNGSGFFARIAENAYDRCVMLIQQMTNKVNRAITVPVSDDPSLNKQLPTAPNRAGKVLFFDNLGNVTVGDDDFAALAAAAEAAADAAADSASDAAANAAIALAQLAAYQTLIASTDGPSHMGLDLTLNYAANTIGWGVRTSGGSFNLWRLIPPSEWAAIANYTSTYDVTSIMTTALATYKDVWKPPGKYVLDPSVGVRFVTGMRLRGAGKTNSVCVALANGGTTAQLASYTKGSIFKRTFTPGVANARLDDVYLGDFSVVMNHPTGAVTTTDIQIALDMRHVSRFVIERVWVGNVAPINGPYVKADPGTYGVQGYGIVCGNINSGDVAYCGGEVGDIINCAAVGCFKNIVIDDLTLSPLSGAHAINVTGCDIQGGHSLLAQEQQYTAQFVWDKNRLQNVMRQPGNASATYVMRVAGYDNKITPGYIEAGVADHILRFDSASANNEVEMGHFSATTIGIAAFSDAGRRNRVVHRRDTGTLAGGVDSKGARAVRYDRSYEEMDIIAHWNGSAVVQDGGFGLTMTRPTGAGDYVFTFALAVVDANNYTVSVGIDSNASGHGGTWAVISHTTSNIRIQFYAQNGGTTTAIDPRFVFVRIKRAQGN